MIRLSESVWQDQSLSSDERRPRRSHRSILGIKSFLPHSYERGIIGSTSHNKKKTDAEGLGELHASRFPAIIAGQNVSYDQVSKLFTVSKINEGVGETYYYEDLPRNIRAEIKKLKLHHTTE